MDFEIRHLAAEDHEAVHTIFLSQHVIDGSMRLPHAPLDYTRSRLAPEDGVIKLVAEAGGEVVGFAELVTYPNVPRLRHSGHFNFVVVREDWQGRGVARRLTETIIDLADKWLQLRRLDLVVWIENTRAVQLYETLGFVIEGTMPEYGYGNGRFIDAYQMGRLQPDQ